MNVDWVRIKSWHAVRFNSGYGIGTYCGRRVDSGAEVTPELPTGKSCESCLRIIARHADVP